MYNKSRLNEPVFDVSKFCIVDYKDDRHLNMLKGESIDFTGKHNQTYRPYQNGVEEQYVMHNI